MKLTVVSNNPLLRAKWADRIALCLVDGGCREVFLAVRDRCHRGARLLSHPLSGSVKPNETPYKSVLLAEAAGGTDAASVMLIEQAIAAADKFGPIRRRWRERELEDFRLVDLCLIESALEAAQSDPGL